MSLIGRGIRVEHKNFTLDVPYFELAPGEVKAVLGPSGSGKTTLLTILGGLEKPDEGVVELDGEKLNARVMKEKVSAVFQFPYLIKGTVEQNVSYGLKLRHTPQDEQHALVKEMLEVVGLAGYEKRSVHELSGGEQQRVALARALVLKPAVLLLDEPLSSLDANLKTRIAQEFAEILHSQHMSAVYVTHDRHEATIVADTLAVMINGRVAAEMPFDNLYRGAANEQVRTFFNMPHPLRALLAHDVSPKDTAITLRLGDKNQPVALSFEEMNNLVSKMNGDREVSIFVSPQDVELFRDEESAPDVASWIKLVGTVATTEEEGDRVNVAVDTQAGRVYASVAQGHFSALGLKVGDGVCAVLTSFHVEKR